MQQNRIDVDSTKYANSAREWSEEAGVCRATVTKLLAEPGPERLRSVKVRKKRIILESPSTYFERLLALQSAAPPTKPRQARVEGCASTGGSS